jgi:hypothetical protein
MTAAEWDVFEMLPGGSAPSYLATLYEAREKSIRVELDGTGSGGFAINRTSPQCTEVILAQGNLVKVRIPEISTGYLFAFFLESGDFTLISSDEAGGEMLHFGGRGSLSYTEFARAWSKSYIDGGQDPTEGVWRAYLAGTGNKPGQILRRLLEEMQDADRPQQPIPLLTIDFDYDLDSNAATWASSAATDEFSYQVGEDGLAVITRLIPTGITVQMGPDFDLHAYNEYGRDLTGAAFGAGVVRFERGVNIATELRREQVVDRVATHELVQGEADTYGFAVLPGAASRVTKEAFLASFGTSPNVLRAIGRADLRQRLNESDTIKFLIANRRTEVDLADPVTVGAVIGPGAAVGSYLPGPDGTSGDFWVGDTVRVHTGSGQFDYDEVDARVMAITITRDDDNHELIVVPELTIQTPIELIDSFCTLTWPGFRIGTSGSTFIGDPAGRMLFANSGDNAHVGDPALPTRGLLSKITGPTPPTYTNWSGILVEGDGTVDIIWSTTLIWVHGGTAYCRWSIMLNGVEIGYDEHLHPNGTWTHRGTVELTGVSVAPGDIIEAYLTFSGTGAPPTSYFSSPAGVGSGTNRLTVNGALV